jgi:hypothetical protein
MTMTSVILPPLPACGERAMPEACLRHDVRASDNL